MSPEFVELETKVTSQLHALTARETQQLPAENPQRWSVQQIVEHLLLTYKDSGAVLLNRRTWMQRASLVQRLRRWTVVRLGVFPAGLEAAEQLRPTRPSTLRSGAELGVRLHVELSRLDTLLADAERMRGSRPVSVHRLFGPLSASQWRRFHLVHGLHHLRQIKAIRREHRA